MAKKAVKRAVKKTKPKRAVSSVKQKDLIEANSKSREKLKEQISRIKKGAPLLKEETEEAPVPEKKQVAPEATEEIKPTEIDETFTPISPEDVEQDIKEAINKPSEADNKPITSTSNNDSSKAVIDSITSDSDSDNAPSKISLFDDLANETEQDEGQLSRLETIADDFNEDFDDNPVEDSEEVKKTNAKVSAGIWVTLIDVSMMVGCLFLSNDFSDESQRKFTLVPERKTAIKQSIYQMLMLRKKKTNPITSLVLAIFGSYAPMFVIAFMTGKRKREQAAEEAKARYTPPPPATTAEGQPATQYPSQQFQRAREEQSQQASQVPNIYTPPTPYKDNSDIVENFGGKLVPIKKGKKKADIK